MLYCSDACHTYELHFSKNNSFYSINTICDVASYEINFGKLIFENNYISFERDAKYYFDQNSKIVELDCVEKEIKFNLIEHLPQNFRSDLNYIYSGVVINGRNSRDEIVYLKLKEGPINIGNRTKPLIAKLDSNSKLKSIWLEYHGSPIGLELELPQSSEFKCLEVDYPILFGQLFETNFKERNLRNLNYKSKSSEKIKLKTRCKIEKVKSS